MDLEEINHQEALFDKIEKFIDTEVKPYLHQDGGDIEALNFNHEAGVLRVSLHGACSTCPSSIMTLKFGVERRLKEEFPEIKSLELASMFDALESA